VCLFHGNKQVRGLGWLRKDDLDIYIATIDRMTIIDLQHMIMVQRYNNMHMKLLRKNNPKMGINAYLLKDHNAKFIRWLKDCRFIRDPTNEGVVTV
jgi:hypothetical protein